MGMIRIMVNGSFPRTGTVQLSAQEGGHAIAISRAIRHLNNLMAGAIKKDHELQSQGVYPSIAPFGEEKEDADKF